MNVGETFINPSTGEPFPCPQCHGSGVATVTEEGRRRMLESVMSSGVIEQKSNAELAGLVSEIEVYLNSRRDVSGVVFQWLQEVWWRLHAANEPIEETLRKIEVLRNDDEWLNAE